MFEYRCCRATNHGAYECRNALLFCFARALFGFHLERFSRESGVWKCNRHRSRCCFLCGRAHIPSFFVALMGLRPPFPCSLPLERAARRLKKDAPSARFYSPLSLLSPSSSLFLSPVIFLHLELAITLSAANEASNVELKLLLINFWIEAWYYVFAKKVK